LREGDGGIKEGGVGGNYLVLLRRVEGLGMDGVFRERKIFKCGLRYWGSTFL
jgi:hypothetical protein